MVKCKCTLAIRMLGEGCRYCQPQECINLMYRVMTENEAEHEAALVQLKNVQYLLRQGRVVGGVALTYTPMHSRHLMILAKKVDALLASQSPPAP